MNENLIVCIYYIARSISLVVDAKATHDDDDHDGRQGGWGGRGPTIIVSDQLLSHDPAISLKTRAWGRERTRKGKEGRLLEWQAVGGGGRTATKK